MHMLYMQYACYTLQQRVRLYALVLFHFYRAQRVVLTMRIRQLKQTLPCYNNVHLCTMCLYRVQSHTVNVSYIQVDNLQQTIKISSR